MKRLLWLILGVVLIILAAGPWVEGQFAWRLLTKHLQLVNQQLKSRGLDASVSLASYQDGWRQSDGHYALAVDMPADKKKPLCVGISAQINHGWQQMLQGRWFDMTLVPENTAQCDGLGRLQHVEAGKFWSGWLKDVRIGAQVAWDGASVIVLNSPAISKNAKKGPQFGAVSGRIAVAPGAQTVSYHLNWDGLQLPKAAAIRSAALNQSALAGIGAVSIDGQQRRYLKRLHTGHFQASVGSIDYFAAIHGQIAHLQSSQLQIQATTTAKQGQLDSNASLDMKALKLNGVAFGSLHLNGQFAGISAQPWDRFNDRILKLQEQASTTDPTSAEGILDQLTNQDISLAQKGLQKATLTLSNSHYRLGKQEIDLQGKVAWPKLGQLAPAQIKASPMALLPVIEAHLDGAMDTGFTALLAARSAQVLGNQSDLDKSQVKAMQANFEVRFDQALQQMIQRGYLTQASNSAPYKIQLTLHKGTLKINGHPWSPHSP